MRLPKELITVTPLSKTLALLLFITLPILAFVFGMNYQKLVVNKQQMITPTPINNNGVACTMDAKICPDGTTVGRVPPDCEFSPCPTEIPVEISYWCGEIAGYKPCPEGYACQYKSKTSGTCEKCPETDYVDCMPGPDKFDSRCNPEYINWAKENCPGFQGAAY